MLAVFFAHAHPARVKALVLSGVPPWELVERNRTRYEQATPQERIAWENWVTRVSFASALHTVRDSAWMAKESGVPPDDPLTPRWETSVCCLRRLPLAVCDAPGLTDLRSLEVPTLIALGDNRIHAAAVRRLWRKDCRMRSCSS